MTLNGKVHLWPIILGFRQAEERANLSPVYWLLDFEKLSVFSGLPFLLGNGDEICYLTEV